MTETLPLDLLIVEDNAADAEMVLRVLREGNPSLRHLVVEDGAQALHFLFGGGGEAARPKHLVPRVILLDIQLPKLGGLEVLRRIKDDPAMRMIPVVMFTSSREETDLREAYRFGANSYVVKPVKFAEFAAAVRTMGEYWLQANLPFSGG